MFKITNFFGMAEQNQGDKSRPSSDGIQGSLSIGYGQTHKIKQSCVLSGVIEVNSGGTLDISCINLTMKDFSHIKINGGNLIADNAILKLERNSYNNEKLLYIENVTEAVVINSLKINGVQKGAGIGILNSKVTFNDCMFENFYSENPGGCIHSSDSELQLVNCIITNSHSTRSGGAILSFSKDKGSLHVENCEFTYCSSDVKGGVISTNYEPKLLTTGNADIKIILSTFFECSSKGRGGAIFLGYDPMSKSARRIMGCGFQQCKATEGGAIFDDYEKLLVSDSVFDKCSPNNYQKKKGIAEVMLGVFGKEFKELVIDPTIQDWFELKDSMKETNREFAEGLVQILKRESPPIGNWAEQVVRRSEMLANGIDAINQERRGSQYEFEVGDHLFIRSLGFTHHGIYIGNGEMIHYAKKNGDEKRSIHILSLEEFSEGKVIYKRHSNKKFSANEIVSRAKSRLSEQEYRLDLNNCEHFCIWCRSGN